LRAKPRQKKLLFATDESMGTKDGGIRKREAAGKGIGGRGGQEGTPNHWRSAARKKDRSDRAVPKRQGTDGPRKLSAPKRNPFSKFEKGSVEGQEKKLQGKKGAQDARREDERRTLLRTGSRWEKEKKWEIIYDEGREEKPVEKFTGMARRGGRRGNSKKIWKTEKTGKGYSGASQKNPKLREKKSEKKV